MMIIPAIDLRHGQCVRLTQGQRDSTKVYDANPLAVAERFQAAGAKMLHVVNLDAAFGESQIENQRVLGELLRAVQIPIQLGGGIRTTDDVARAIELGARRVVVGTVAVKAPQVLEQMVRLGSQHIVVGIDARQGQVVTHGWEQSGTIDALDLAQRVAVMGVERVVYTDVQRDGMLTGPNIEQARLVAGAGVTVTISGGISSLQDLLEIKALSDPKIDSVIVGKALYEGRFTLAEALAAASR